MLNPGTIINLFYTPPKTTPEEYEHYLSVRDGVLGWPSPLTTIENLDSSGARVSPAFPVPGGECVSLYGDSFTFGSEVMTSKPGVMFSLVNWGAELQILG